MPQYILLPKRGLTAREPGALGKLLPMGSARSTAPPITPADQRLRALGMQVIDSVHEDGPKLVDLSPGAARELQDTDQDLRLEPLRGYRLATITTAGVAPPPGAATGPALQVQVVCSSSGQAVPGAKVVAFTSFSALRGAEGTADATGCVELRLGAVPAPVEKVYVTGPIVGYWGHFAGPRTLNNGDVIRIEPIGSAPLRVLTHFYGATSPAASAEIKIGIIDAGAGPHPDLFVHGGRNTVTGEPITAIQDNGIGHGTHVAGIVASQGTAMRGLAPGVTLYSYRAFAQGSAETTNYSILKALIYAVDDSCDLVNLSLAGEARPDATLEGALEDAKQRGTLVIMAAGNDFRKFIAYPAAYADQTGIVVSAFGRTTCFPSGACESDMPVGTDPDDFVAPFTNIGSSANSGPQVSFTAPGVGVISTVPGGYGAMSGTSMAAPAVTGTLARLLTADLVNPNPVLRRTRDAQRVLDMIQMADAHAAPLGFGRQFEGRGLPR